MLADTQKGYLAQTPVLELEVGPQVLGDTVIHAKPNKVATPLHSQKVLQPRNNSMSADMGILGFWIMRALQFWSNAAGLLAMHIFCQLESAHNPYESRVRCKQQLQLPFAPTKGLSHLNFNVYVMCARSCRHGPMLG